MVCGDCCLSTLKKKLKKSTTHESFLLNVRSKIEGTIEVYKSRKKSQERTWLIWFLQQFKFLSL